jgi:HAD superfamily hydrolase (TIGR01509 family)
MKPPDAPLGIGFDVDHTIAIDNKLERIALLRLLEPIAAQGGRVLPSLDQETAAIDDLLVRQRAGEFSIDEAVGRFVRERGIVAREGWYVERFRRLALQMVDELVIPLPGAKETFAALHERGIRTAVLSNGWNPLQLRKARQAGFEGPVLASSEIGAQKPDSRAYAALLAELATPAESTWYVGDDPRCDVEGARAAGLHAVWLDAEDRPFPADWPPPGRTIAALADLIGLLPARKGGAAALAPQESA